MSKTECCNKLGKTATGISKKGDLQEAIDIAVAAALNSVPGADMQIKWKLECVSGVEGGFAPKRDLTVEISYEV